MKSGLGKFERSRLYESVCNFCKNQKFDILSFNRDWGLSNQKSLRFLRHFRELLPIMTRTYQLRQILQYLKQSFSWLLKKSCRFINAVINNFFLIKIFLLRCEANEPASNFWRLKTRIFVREAIENVFIFVIIYKIMSMLSTPPYIKLAANQKSSISS